MRSLLLRSQLVIAILCLFGLPVAAQLDVAFVLDTSATTTIDLNILRTVLFNIMTRVRDGTEPDVQFGIVAFQDYDLLPFGADTDKPYLLVADMQDDIANVTNVANLAMMSLDPGFGGDREESVLTALFQMITGEGQFYGQDEEIPEGLELEFRSDAQKIIALYTDNEFHDPLTDAGYPGPNFTAVTDLLVENGMKVVALSRREDDATRDDMEILTMATGSQVRNGTDTFECFVGGTELEEGDELVCEGVTNDAQVIEDAFVNMIVTCYEPDEFTPLTCGGVYGLVCVFTGFLASVLSFFT